MKKVNFFDAVLLEGSDKSVQFTIIVPTDNPGPHELSRVLNLIFSTKVSFVGGEGKYDYFDQEAEDDE